MTLRQTAKNLAAALEETGQARFGTRSIEWAADILEPMLAELLKVEREACAAKCREYADHYPPHSDGRNTFVLLAEWIDSRNH
jgi:hypothetical protein